MGPTAHAQLEAYRRRHRNIPGQIGMMAHELFIRIGARIHQEAEQAPPPNEEPGGSYSSGHFDFPSPWEVAARRAGDREETVQATEERAPEPEVSPEQG